MIKQPEYSRARVCCHKILAASVGRGLLIIATLVLPACDRQATDVSIFQGKATTLADRKHPDEDRRDAQDREARTPIILRHDFSSVGPETINTCRLLLKNDGNQPWVFDAAKPSCSCIAAKKMPASIGPGDIGEFVLELDTTGKRGKTRQRVMFFSEENRSVVVVAEVSALVTAVWADPEVLDMGDLTIGIPKKAEFFVVAAGHQNAQLVSAHADDEWLTVTPADVGTSKQTLATGVRAVAKLSVDWTGMHIPPGLVASRITITTTAPTHPTVRVQVTGCVIGEFVAVPSPIIFGRLVPGVEVRRECTLRRGEATRSHDEIECFVDHDFVHAVVKHRSPAESIQYELSVTATTPLGASTGFIRGTIRGQSKRTGKTVFSVPYVAYAHTK